jgi:hypothetical protein
MGKVMPLTWYMSCFWKLKLESSKGRMLAAFLLDTDLIINEPSAKELINALHNAIIEHFS